MAKQLEELNTELTEEQKNELEEERQEKLSSFGDSLARMRDDWINSRYSMGVDKRWM